MNPLEIQNTLQTAVTLIRQGQKEQGRDLLLQVVQADENNEIAWLWLGAVVDSLEDQITALENVLAINPNNSSAQKGLAQLRAQQPDDVPPFIEEALEPEIVEALETTEPAIETEADSALAPDWLTNTGASPEPKSKADWDLDNYADRRPIDSVSALDDPYQCVYCGAIAAPNFKRCPECNRNLMVLEGSRKLSASLRTAVTAVLACIALAALEAIAVAIFYYQNDAFSDFIFNSYSGLVTIIIGDFHFWSKSFTPLLVYIQFGLIAVMVVTMLGLLYQVTLAYYFSVALFSANIIWMIYRWLTGYFGPVIALADIIFSIISLLFIFAAQPDFQVNATRLRCAVDSHVKGGDALNRLGHIAKGKSQWALAVAYWRAAVAAMPNQPDFYKDLAIGYAQIGYYQKAMSALNEFANLSRGTADYEPMKALIEQKLAKDKYPRG
jgi:tetratricopeptide (TPR) repeat protein